MSTQVVSMHDNAKIGHHAAINITPEGKAFQEQ
jgi:hypothetical protein